jgi:hypothetical protein
LNKKSVEQTPLYYAILNRPFVVSVFQNMQLVYDSLKKNAEAVKKDESAKELKKSKKSQKSKPYVRPTLTLEQNYHHEVSQYMSGLIHTIERLEEIPFYLARFPNSPTFKEQGITLHKWIHYHYSNYLINVVTIYDTTLILGNAVFFLGLPPKNCSEENVAKNSRVKLTNVKLAIDKIKEVTKSYREPRNLFVHRGILPNLGELDEYESLRFIHETQEELGIKADPLVPIWIVEHIYKDERRKFIHNLREETKKLANTVGEYFDALEPIYITMTKQLE